EAVAFGSACLSDAEANPALKRMVDPDACHPGAVRQRSSVVLVGVTPKPVPPRLSGECYEAERLGISHELNLNQVRRNQIWHKRRVEVDARYCWGEIGGR